ncbi:hypothetical protein FIV42_02910 [Persicimonas caeni]|uniref:Uncharacterized protein n=1 Tax=Persicimonas caeni TaxID=2292766 RepID=A0A4Y6PN65_PERCE|nr:hypothetical protein [Persicimonas caeni]QDG49724.1 hypothetical protein FIV42_02910 [Persicimonas caeni]QED30945.1 hypothetical protein FRD00_02905 [Persicimonas caeni]
MKSWFKEAAVVIAAMGLAGTAAAQDVSQQQAQQQQRQQQQQIQQPQQAQQRGLQQQGVQQQGILQNQQQIRQIGGGPIAGIGAHDVRHFLQFSEVSQQQDVQISHEHASKGLNLLWSSLNTIANQPVMGPGAQAGGGPTQTTVSQSSNFQQSQQALRSLALRLEENSQIPQHPQILKQASLAAASTIGSIQQARFPELQSQVQQLNNSAQQIDVNQPVAAQDKQVRQFLKQSSDVVRAMAEKTWQSQQSPGQQGQ